mgnify:FL=1
MKKRVLATVLAAIMGLSMTACGGGNATSNEGDAAPATESGTKEADSASDEDVTIRFYNYALSEAAKADWWENTISNFEKENPNITIDTVTVDYNSMVSTFTNDIASGLSVDMVYGEISWIPALAEAGFIQAPSQVLSKDFYDGYYDYVLDQFQYNGEVYGVPHYYTNSVIFVNKDLVEAAGLSLADFPDTLDGLKEWIETLSDYYKDDANVSTVFGLTTAEVPATGSNINAMYEAFGGTLINDDGTLADLTTEPNKTAMNEMLDFYKYLISNGYTQENLKLKDYRASFGAGNVCMYVDSSWGYAQIGEVDANAANFTATEALPTTMGTNGKGNSLVEAHCFLLGSTLTDAQKTAVDKFIQYCTQTDTMQDYLNNIGVAFPAHEQMADCELSPILDGAKEGVDHVVTQTMIPSLSSIQIELATMVLNYTVNGMSEEDAVNNYIQQAEYYINQ